jgi:predicted DCC family thiol-disulfide oxidoreductase YuxK
MAPSDSRGVIFFDGYCGVCDAFVSLLLPRAERAGLCFSPLQGETAASLLSRRPELKDVDSVLFATGLGGPDERVFARGDALLGILRRLDGPLWALLRVLVAFAPRRLRDAIYDLVARWRYRMAERRQTCRLPTPEEGAFFLP